VPENGADGDDWTVVRVWKRKVQGQVVRGQDKQWDFKRQGGSSAGHKRRSRFRSSSRFDQNDLYGEPVNPMQCGTHHNDHNIVWERLEFPSITHQKQSDTVQTYKAGAVTQQNEVIAAISEF